MKIIANVILTDEERKFDIACGNGERTFKWLASTAMQRWAQSVPNGNLRRCDLKHGITDRVQYSTTNVLLPSGEIPHPEAKLREFLQYGDQVTINLTGNQRVNAYSGVPKHSDWNTVAFVTTASNNGQDDSDESEEDDDIEYDENGHEIEAKYTKMQIKADVRQVFKCFSSNVQFINSETRLVVCIFIYYFHLY